MALLHDYHVQPIMIQISFPNVNSDDSESHNLLVVIRSSVTNKIDKEYLKVIKDEFVDFERIVSNFMDSTRIISDLINRLLNECKLPSSPITIQSNIPKGLTIWGAPLKIIQRQNVYRYAAAQQKNIARTLHS